MQDSGGMKRKWCVVFCLLGVILFTIFFQVCMYKFVVAFIPIGRKKVLTMSVISTAFKMLESSSQKFLQGLVYLIGNLMGLALAVYKCQSMGLLPTHASDWLAFIEPPEVRLMLNFRQMGCMVNS